MNIGVVNPSVATSTSDSVPNGIVLDEKLIFDNSTTLKLVQST